MRGPRVPVIVPLASAASRGPRRPRALPAAAAAGMLLGLCVAPPPPAEATTTSFWVSEGFEEFAEGTTDSTAITAEGAIVLAPRRSVVARSSEAYLWDIAVGKDGTCYLATGNEGRLLQVRRGGEVSTLFDAPDEVEIFALLQDPVRGLLAGLSPGASLVAIRASGAVDTVAHLEAKYIWDLLRSPAGDVFIATGQPGRVYRLAAGKSDAELYFDSQDEHVLCLAWHAAGYLLAGTSSQGITFAITAAGQARALYDARQREAKALAVAADGSVFVGATGDTQETSEGGDGKAEPAVYRIRPDGTVQRTWRCPEQVLQAMAITSRGEILVATGNKAKIYRLDPDSRDMATVLAMLPESQAVSLLAIPEGTFAGTANPGVLYQWGTEKSREGFFTAKVFDAGQVSRWGALLGEQAESGHGASVAFESRSGNTAEPGLGWSDWTPLGADGTAGAVLSPAARYLQWRAKLTRRGSDEADAGLVRVKVAYLSPNLPPRIPRLEVSADGATLTAGAPGSAPPPLHQVLPSGVEVQYSVREQAAPSPEGPPAWANALRTATWEAVDPNDDPLTFRIEIRALGETTWQLLEKEFEGLAYTWNTASLPDGLYQLRVTASDRPGNPSGEERTAEKISAAFNVDHTPPEIVRLEVTGAGKGPLRLEATARDRGGCLLRASYALDGRDWRPVSPADGIFDEAEEVFSCVLPDADEGSRGLVFRVADESGNVTARRAAVSP